MRSHAETGLNAGAVGESFAVFPVDHPTHVALIEPNTGYWALVARDQIGAAKSGGPWLETWRSKSAELAREMETLRFHLTPSAVYLNPTELCNLNCRYCYIPEAMRASRPPAGGPDPRQMDEARLFDALQRLAGYFRRHLPPERLPQIIFHGAEPMLARDAIFAAIEAFGDRFRFGLQTNATLLDDEAIAFLTQRGVGIGLSLDGPNPTVAARTRRSWDGHGVFDAVVRAIDQLKGYPGFNVICTMTLENLPYLSAMVEFLHSRHVPACMLNVTRCTMPEARTLHGEDADVAAAYVAALERSHQLYRETGRKLVVANFANILMAILAPTARRLMCDISPCGGGRSFFAVAPDGATFPCSEFIGLPAFNGGNLFEQPIETILESAAFRRVTGRRIEAIAGCGTCSIRHFCGSPCPAEAHEMNGDMQAKGAFCRFYEEQVRYAFRLIAAGTHEDFLWDGWDTGTTVQCAVGI